ncbi:MAG TPA: aminotransferase class III-fold pyridoxal phosphate-dependent enzyme [Candidatus Limnocylindrales bacterium]|nr:aminotransferase class III-fold pyridoxal phosphate-dependent enzyme [Candidatus Limnocylindrales bacterium]
MVLFTGSCIISGAMPDDDGNDLLAAYLARTPRSAAMFERAAGALPGGSTRTTIYSAPYPPYMTHGQGLRTWDVDGNEYRDFLGNYTSLILGHAHPGVVAAVEAQVRRGSAFAAPTETEIELAEELRRRLPSVELIRFTNSGTEATMFAIRAARAFTGRPLLAKFEGAYHGTHDAAVAWTAGVPAGVSDLVLELPWGDEDGVKRALRGREGAVAAIIIEPIQGAGGVRAAHPEFLRFLRDLTLRIGALLIFDEVIAFRVGPNGAQGRLGGVRPDLTTLGKIIGGGYPSGGFGGRAEVMGQFDARRSGALVHGGTFNGNPVSAAAGLATLRELTPARYAELERLGERLRRGLAAGIRSAEIDARVGGVASIFQVFPGSSLRPPEGLSPQAALFLGLLLDGFHLAPRGMGALSTPVTDVDVDDLVAAILARLGAMQPVAA